jgi:hypothetical protein
MRFRTILIGFLAVWGLFAIAGFRNCGRPENAWEPEHPPSLNSTDPSEVTQAYWLAAKEINAKAVGAMPDRDALGRALNSQNAAEGSRLWAEVAASYSRATKANANAVHELESLPTARTDSIAVDCVTELREILVLQGEVLRKSGEQCADLSALLEAIQGEGATFDWESSKGKEYKDREAQILEHMKLTMENEGKLEKQRLYEFSVKVQTIRKTLSEKHSRVFPHLFVD